MKQHYEQVVVFELPSAMRSTIEYRFNPKTNTAEVWCVIYGLIDGKPHIADGTLLRTVSFRAYNDYGIDIREEAVKDFAGHYQFREWDEGHALDVALGLKAGEIDF